VKRIQEIKVKVAEENGDEMSVATSDITMSKIY
jgi:hypothetical protein